MNAVMDNLLQSANAANDGIELLLQINVSLIQARVNYIYHKNVYYLESFVYDIIDPMFTRFDGLLNNVPEGEVKDKFRTIRSDFLEHFNALVNIVENPPLDVLAPPTS